MRSASKSYAFAILVTLISVVATRLTWPFFASAPFAPVFGAVAIATHWGGAGPGLVAILLATVGTVLAFPGPGDPFGWTSPTLLVFIAIALIGSRLIAGRNKAAAALRASEAALRATLEHVRESEERLRRAHKMEAVGQLAAGVAHNFNNLLQVTMGYTEILMDSRRDGDLDDMAIAEIRRATERGASLTRQLLAFGRKHDAKVLRMELDATIGSLRGMLSRVTREDIDLRLSLDSDGAAVMIDPFDLEQVIFNLVLNARDALPAGGTIAIEVTRAPIGALNRPSDQPVAPGEYARICVRDNGTGMTEDVQSHLFEPFFTTKEVGQGTGLGLAFVDGIARHGGGFVTVESAPGKGTAIAVFLPLTPAAVVPAGEARRDPVRPPRHAATILLVEDENAVRTMTAQMLGRAGYHVLSAPGPAEASALFDLHSAAIDLLLTDVVMPGMHGPELAARFAGIRPDLPVVFVSGYSDEMPVLAVVSARATFVPKPFSASSLISAVEGMLSHEGNPG